MQAATELPLQPHRSPSVLILWCWNTRTSRLPPHCPAWTLSQSRASARVSGRNGNSPVGQGRPVLKLLLLNLSVTSACFPPAGYDFECPPGSLRHQAAPVSVLGRVTWDPGPCLEEQELGSHGNLLPLIGHQLSCKCLTSTFHASRTCWGGDDVGLFYS